MVKILIFFYFILPLFGNEDDLLKQIKNEAFIFSSEVSTAEVFTGREFNITGSVHRRLPVAGKPVKIIHLDKGCIFDAADNAAETSLETGLDGSFSVSARAKNPGRHRIGVFFLDHKYFYNQHAEFLEVKVISPWLAALNFLLLLSALFFCFLPAGKDSNIKGLKQSVNPWLMLNTPPGPSLWSGACALFFPLLFISGQLNSLFFISALLLLLFIFYKNIVRPSDFFILAGALLFQMVLSAGLAEFWPVSRISSILAGYPAKIIFSLGLLAFPSPFFSLPVCLGMGLNGIIDAGFCTVLCSALAVFYAWIFIRSYRLNLFKQNALLPDSEQTGPLKPEKKT
ncbi:MAG TPA: hypothetical protein DC049_17035 [Spirochaetia bacterium]|nr:hypothetical protein [Spirochaetia bacterium]